MAKIIGQDVTLPDNPLSRTEQYLEYIAEYGGDSTFATKGSVSTVDDLPTTAEAGDLYIVTATGYSYVWDGSDWVQLAATSVTDDGAGTVTMTIGG